MVLRRASKYQLILAFFGLTYNIIPEFRVSLFTSIHEIIFHGNGGYDYNTVYNMPIWLRKFTFNKLKEYYEKQNENSKQSQSGNSKKVTENGKVVSPEFLKNAQPPTYTTTKASKK